MSFYSDAYLYNITWPRTDYLKDYDTDVTKISYFNITQKSKDDLATRMNDSSSMKQDQKDYFNSMLAQCPMWKLLLNSYSENHSEAFSIDKGVSDSFTVMSTGTNTIKIAMSGVLLVWQEYDYRLDFLSLYDNFFRGYKLEDNNLELQVVIDDTSFNYKIAGLNYSQDPNMPDFIRLSMQGIAYNYSVIPTSIFGNIGILGL